MWWETKKEPSETDSVEPVVTADSDALCYDKLDDMIAELTVEGTKKSSLVFSDNNLAENIEVWRKSHWKNAQEWGKSDLLKRMWSVMSLVRAVNPKAVPVTNPESAPKGISKNHIVVLDKEPTITWAVYNALKSRDENLSERELWANTLGILNVALPKTIAERTVCVELSLKNPLETPGKEPEPVKKETPKMTHKTDSDHPLW